MLDLASIGSMLSRQPTIKALIRLICTFVVRIWHDRFSHVVAHVFKIAWWPSAGKELFS